MLATVRIAGFLILIVFAGESLSNNAYLDQGGGNYAAGKSNLLSERKTVQISIENNIMGRKMVSGQDFTKMETMKEVKVRSRDPQKYRNLISRENFGARFVAFNADYKGPRHHPPKNN